VALSAVCKSAAVVSAGGSAAALVAGGGGCGSVEASSTVALKSSAIERTWRNDKIIHSELALLYK